MQNCNDCRHLSEAFASTVELAYYLLSNEISIEERARLKEQFETMFKQMAENPPPPSPDTPDSRIELP